MLLLRCKKHKPYSSQLSYFDTIMLKIHSNTLTAWNPKNENKIYLVWCNRLNVMLFNAFLIPKY